MGPEVSLSPSMSADRRVDAFLASSGWGDAQQHLLPGDFSARTYIRLNRGGGDPARALVMCMPKAMELQAFLTMQGHLEKSGVRVPAVYAVDQDSAMALIEDLGVRDLGMELEAGGDTEKLYKAAIDILVQMHRKVKAPDAGALGLPHFNASLFLEQVALFLDVYGPKILGVSFAPDARAGFMAAWHAALEQACAIQSSFLFRDYHAANIMIVAGVPAVIDFQDGGVGPVSYDLVSLLEDARRDMDPALREKLMAYYIAESGVDARSFRASATILAAQRHMRILAIVARRWLDQNRPEAGDFFRRTWRLLNSHAGEPALKPVFAWLDAYVPVNAREGWTR